MHSLFFISYCLLVVFVISREMLIFYSLKSVYLLFAGQRKFKQGVYVVVQFYPWFNFNFPLFFFMLIYDNECETKGNKN